MSGGGDEENLILPVEPVAADPEITGSFDSQLIQSPDPSEPLPDLPIEDLLSAAMNEDAQAFALPLTEETPAQATLPTFQLHFLTLPEAARPPMKKAAEGLGIAVGENAWASAAPVVSQLTEFQALSLLQAARALGLSVQGAVQRPLPLPTEDDLALGDLSAIAEPEISQVESAPSVVLPKGEKDVLLCTPEALPGLTVTETLGIVMAHRSIARRLFREEDLREKLEKELRSVPNRGSVPLPSSRLQVLLRDLLLDLRKSALAKGGNAVLGVKMEAFPESSSSDPQLEQLRLVAFGTAAVVEKS